MYSGNPRYCSPQQLAQNASQYLPSSTYLPLRHPPQNSAQRYVQNPSLQQLGQPTTARSSNHLPLNNQITNTSLSLSKVNNSHSSHPLMLSLNSNINHGVSRLQQQQHSSTSLQKNVLSSTRPHSWTMTTEASSPQHVSQLSMLQRNMPNVVSPNRVLPNQPLNAGTAQLAHTMNQLVGLRQSSQVSQSIANSSTKAVRIPSSSQSHGQFPFSSGVRTWQGNVMPQQTSRGIPHSSNHLSSYSSTHHQPSRQVGHALQSQQSSLHMSRSLPQTPNRSLSLPIPSPVGMLQEHSNILRSPLNLAGPLNLNTAASHQTQQATVANVPEKRDKIRITFDQKSNQNQVTSTLSQSMLKRNISKDSNRDEEDVKQEIKPPLVLDNTTRIVIDDDLEIVGSTEAEIMSHIRSDCPIHRYVRVDSVSLPPDPSNLKNCDKCFCYICDKLAAQCSQWTTIGCPHCNANSRSSCWKARRNMKKSPLMNMLTAEEITPKITAAGELAMKHMVRTREAYITYRNGTPCEPHRVPCVCTCHRDMKNSGDVCSQCKTVHDMKKSFNYDPVRCVILDIIKEIRDGYSCVPCCALVLFEALLSELCSHRPADFNHIRRMPSNPDVRCQCNTPTIMDEYIEGELVTLFTLHEIPTMFKQKFIKCVNASIQPLQLKDVMKRFMTMRHWDDQLLRSVLSGQNMSGKWKTGETLKETPQVIELRVQKLARENRFVAIVRYLNTLRVLKNSKQVLSDGSKIEDAIDKWKMYYSAKRGCFKEVCFKLAENTGIFNRFSVQFFVSLFSTLSGEGLLAQTELISSFVTKHPVPYKIEQADKTVLLFVAIIFLDVNKAARSNFSCYLWLAKWVNRERLPHNQSMVRAWVHNSQELFDLKQRVAKVENLSWCLSQCLAFAPQAALLTCSRLILQFLTNHPNNMSYIPNLIEAYQNNPWALFLLFSQPVLITYGNHHMITWLTEHMKVTGGQVGLFKEDSLNSLIANNQFVDVCDFMKALIGPNWINNAYHMHPSIVAVTAKFAHRVLSEAPTSSSLHLAEWMTDTVLHKIMEKSLYQDETLSRNIELIAKASAVVSIRNLDTYKSLAGQTRWTQLFPDIFYVYQQRFQKNLLKPEDVKSLLYYSAQEGSTVTMKLIFSYFTERHDCNENTTSLLIDEIVSILGWPQDRFKMQKHELIHLSMKLCAHETLSWLICAKCSSKMPDKWKHIWISLATNKMLEDLDVLVKHTLQQFTSWMKELAVSEENDIKRLLRCLDVFTANAARTLVSCQFEIHKLEDMIMETRLYIANTQLRLEYQKIIEKVFLEIKQEIARKTKPESTISNIAPTVRTTARIQAVSRKPPIVDNVSAIVHNVPGVVGIPQTIIEPHRSAQNDTRHRGNMPQTSVKPDEFATNDVIRSPQNTSQFQKPPTSKQPHPASHAEPPLKNPQRNATSHVPTEITYCPQCGDAMTSSFKCSKCHTRKSRDISCPNCKQVNNDLKGYSCRFCYTSLLGVLTTGEAMTAELPPIEKEDVPKKSRKLKKKAPESATMLKDTVHNDGNYSKKHHNTDQHRVSDKDGSTAVDQQPRLKTTIQKDKKDHFRVKESVFDSPSASRNSRHKEAAHNVKSTEKSGKNEQNSSRNHFGDASVVRDDTRNDAVLLKMPNKDQTSGIANRTQQTKLTSPPRVHRISSKETFPHLASLQSPKLNNDRKQPNTSPKLGSDSYCSKNKELYSTLSDSSDSSDNEEQRQPPKVQPLRLKKKIEPEKSQDVKKTETEPPRRASFGVSAPKKKRETLQLIKSVETVKISKIGKSELSLSGSNDSSDEERVKTQQLKVEPLILKRKIEHEKSQDAKKMRQEPPKRSFGISMSKKQRNMLHRIKNVGKVKSQIKATKSTPKNPTSVTYLDWETTRRRKPGPSSKTTYYTINRNWKLPYSVKIPLNLHMPKICLIHLSIYPVARLERIRRHQPDLRLGNLYA